MSLDVRADRDRRPSGSGPWVICLLLLATAGGGALAQEPAAETAGDSTAAAVALFDPYDPRLPVGAVRSFIDAARDGDYDEAAAFLNLSGLAADERDRGPELARRLKIVLDRALWIHYEMMSVEPQGDRDDGLPPDLERVAGEGELEVLLERVPAGDGEPIWKFAASTVARIDSLYDEYGYGPLGELLPSATFELQLFEVQLWQWLGLLVLVFAAWLVARIVVFLARQLLRPIVRRTRTDLDDRLLEILMPPARMLVWIGAFAVGSMALRLSVPAYRFLGSLEKALVVVAITWVGLRAVDVVAALIREHLEERDQKSAIAILPLGGRAVKVALVAVALVGVLQNLGVNVTGLIAGLSIGGLAVGLAAQKSIANLFGGVSMAVDQPIRVGDFCRFGDKVGTVEQIGLRSTRVRTLDRTLVTVPNAEFSELQLESFAARDRIRLFAMIGLRYETSSDQLRYVISEVRRLLLAHPMLDDPARVRFVGFGAHSLDLEVFAYVKTTDWNQFLQVREDVFLRLMDIVEGSGTGFAFPSQALYLGRDGGLDQEATRHAEEQVRAWRERGELPFPDFNEETVNDLRGSADWPPRGSVTAVPS